MSLKRVVDEPHNLWWTRRIEKNEDPNLLDLLVLAETFRTIFELNLGTPYLLRRHYVSMIDHTADVMLGTRACRIHPWIRGRSKEIVIDELIELSERLEHLSPCLGNRDEIVMKSLFLYSAYLNMAKICREETGQGDVITQAHRLQVYAWLLDMAESNPWIRDGVKMVKYHLPDQVMITDWIPPDSLYHQIF